MADFTIKKGDRLPSITATLTHSDSSGGLSTADSVKFIMRLPGSGVAKINAVAELTTTTDTALEVRYDWADGDTVLSGEYQSEWEVTHVDGRKETFPNNGYNTVLIYSDLG